MAVQLAEAAWLGPQVVKPITAHIVQPAATVARTGGTEAPPASPL